MKTLKARVIEPTEPFPLKLKPKKSLMQLAVEQGHPRGVTLEDLRREPRMDVFESDEEFAEFLKTIDDGRDEGRRDGTTGN